MIDSKLKKIQFTERAAALKAVTNVAGNTTVLIDLDETLFLRNSTAEYLNTLQPRIIGLFILKFLGLIKPWNWLQTWKKNPAIRDWFLVVISTLLMPWTIFLWQQKAKKLAKNHGNQELIQALNKNQNASIIIATLGFSFIVNPIVRSLEVRYDRLICCRFWQGLFDRAKGKLAMIQEVLQPEEIAEAIVITDSYDDLPLLERVAQPYLTIWPLAQYIVPMGNMYLPFLYLEKVKRPNSNYFLRLIVADDFPLLLLAFVWGSSNTLWHGLGMLFLMLSFWCIYEVGYYENDLIGEKYEDQPVLSPSYFVYKAIVNPWQPWAWAIGFGTLGIAALKIPEILITSVDRLLNATLLSLACWMGCLVLSRCCFWIYNYFNKQTRIWLYWLLQASRYFVFAVLFPINLIGTSLLSSHIISRNMLYTMYRYSGGEAKNWPYQIPEKFLRLSLFIFLLATLAIGSQSWGIWQSWQTGAAFGWLIVQGIGQIKQVSKDVKLVTQDGAN
jgi:hypothetical protein